MPQRNEPPGEDRDSDEPALGYQREDAYLLARMLMLRVYAATNPDQLPEVASLERVAAEELARQLRHDALVIPMTWATRESQDPPSATRVENALEALDSDLETATGDGLLPGEVVHQLRELARRVLDAVQCGPPPDTAFAAS